MLLKIPETITSIPLFKTLLVPKSDYTPSSAFGIMFSNFFCCCVSLLKMEKLQYSPVLIPSSRISFPRARFNQVVRLCGAAFNWDVEVQASAPRTLPS